MKCEDCDGCGEVECECNDCGNIHMTDCIYCGGTGEVEDDDEEIEHAATMALRAKPAGVPPLKEASMEGVIFGVIWFIVFVLVGFLTGGRAK